MTVNPRATGNFTQRRMIATIKDAIDGNHEPLIIEGSYSGILHGMYKNDQDRLFLDICSYIEQNGWVQGFRLTLSDGSEVAGRVHIARRPSDTKDQLVIALCG